MLIVETLYLFDIFKSLSLLTIYILYFHYKIYISLIYYSRLCSVLVAVRNTRIYVLAQLQPEHKSKKNAEDISQGVAKI